MPRKLHRWMTPLRPSPQLTIRECANCGLKWHSHHEHQGGKDVHWSTFHRPDGTMQRDTHGRPECTGYVPVRDRAKALAAHG